MDVPPIFLQMPNLAQNKKNVKTTYALVRGVAMMNDHFHEFKDPS